MENEITKEINIEHRFHRTMIGTKGEKIREIRDKYNQVSSENVSLGFSWMISSCYIRQHANEVFVSRFQVQITFPDASKQSNMVVVRGPREDVNAVVAYLSNFNKELVENNYQVCGELGVWQVCGGDVLGVWRV